MINLQYLRNLNYFVSIRLFLRRNVKGRVLAYNKLKLSIHKKSSLLIKDAKFLIINADWNSESNQSGLIVLRKNALLKVNDNFKIYDGHKIIIKPNAKLELGSGYINSSVNINCSKEIIIGYGVAIAENVEWGNITLENFNKKINKYEK